jgi:Carboxypeptidase regulatory-like domain
VREHDVASPGSWIRSGLAFIVILVSGTTVAFAQTAGSGEISGTVTDPGGAVVPGAAVLVHNTDTSADRSLTTNGDGIYSATFLQPGHYEITVNKAGFAGAKRSDILLEVGRTLSINFALRPDRRR